MAFFPSERVSLRKKVSGFFLTLAHRFLKYGEKAKGYDWCGDRVLMQGDMSNAYVSIDRLAVSRAVKRLVPIPRPVVFLAVDERRTTSGHPRAWHRRKENGKAVQSICW